MRFVVGCLGVVVAAAGCPANNIIEDPIPPEQCDGAGYAAFDPANHAEQDERTAAHLEIMELLEAGVDDGTQAAAKADEAEAIYAGSAELQAKVQGRTDDHFADKPNAGAAIDARITAAFDVFRDVNSTELDREIAEEIVDKSFAHFFFLSVFHEMTQGRADKWDEAFGYYGAGADNDLASLAGFAKFAREIDEENGTALEALAFQRIVDGSCALAIKLRDDQVEVVDPFAVEDVNSAIEEIDSAMQQGLAQFVGHEAVEIEENRDLGNVDEARIELVELEQFFLAIEPLMSEANASAIRDIIDPALADDTDAWLATFDVDAIVAAVEAEYAVEIAEEE